MRSAVGPSASTSIETARSSPGTTTTGSAAAGIGGRSGRGKLPPRARKREVAGRDYGPVTMPPRTARTDKLKLLKSKSTNPPKKSTNHALKGLPEKVVDDQ